MSGLFQGLNLKGLFEFDGEEENEVKTIEAPATSTEFVCDDVDRECIEIAGCNVWINADFKIKFQQLADYIQLANLAQHIVRVDSFNCRKCRWSTNWSYHSYGQAIDINPVQFPGKNAPVGHPDRYDIPAWYRQLVDYAKSLGFLWGGDWNTVYDPMHLQIGSRWVRNI